MPRQGNYKRTSPEDFKRRFYSKYSINEFELLSEYVKSSDKILIKHIPCGYEFKRIAHSLINKNGKCSCPKCDKKVTQVIPYVNDLWVSAPDIAQMLANPEDGHRLRPHSNTKALFRCPICERTSEQYVYHISERGFSCPYCGDGVSYVEKFFANLLFQIGIKFEREFSPDWAKPYLFDFYFKTDKDYIVELDGGWHYRDNNMSGLSLEESSKIDLYKEKLAKDNGFELIRIDADYKSSNRYIYFKQSLINSSLSEILDFTKVDFSFCHEWATHTSYAYLSTQLWLDGKRSFIQISDELGLHEDTVKNYIKAACDSHLIPYTYDEVKELNKEYYKAITRRMPKNREEMINDWMNGLHHFASIAKKYGVNKGTVQKNFQYGCNNGLLPYTYKEVLEINKSELQNYIKINRGIKVLCNETGEIFDKYEDADKKYHAKLSCYFAEDRRKYSGTLPDGTRLTWQKVV